MKMLICPEMLFSCYCICIPNAESTQQIVDCPMFCVTIRQKSGNYHRSYRNIKSIKLSEIIPLSKNLFKCMNSKN